MVKNGKLEVDTFTGPEHCMIMVKTQLDTLIPDHPKLQEIKILLANFVVLMDQLNLDMTEEEISQI